MKKLLILVIGIALIICYVEAKKKSFGGNSNKFIRPKGRRSLNDANSFQSNKRSTDDQDDLEYLDFMKSLDWDELVKNNITLTVDGKSYMFTHEFIKKLQQYHESV